MSDLPDSIISHVSLGTNDFARALAFYDKIMPVLGCKQIMQFGEAVAYGRAFPEFWVQAPFDGKAASVGNGIHVCFLAASQAQVDAFYAAAMAAGASDDGAPGLRPDYSANYYAAFVRDPDGNKIEAMHLPMEEMEAEVEAPPMGFRG